MRKLLVALLLILAAATTTAGQQTPDLAPVDGVFSSPSLLSPYYVAVRDALVGEDSYRKCQMVVLPSFHAEWAVYIVQDVDSAPGRLLYKTMREPLWGAMMQQIERNAPDPRSYSVGAGPQANALAKLKRDVEVHVLELDAATIAALERTWLDMLARTRYPTKLEIGLDGTSYVAANWSAAVGPRSGETWSPETGTPTADLVAIAEKLRDLTLAASDSQAALKDEVVAMATALHTRLEALK